MDNPINLKTIRASLPFFYAMSNQNRTASSLSMLMIMVASLLSATTLFGPHEALSSEAMGSKGPQLKEMRVPATLDPGIDHLLALADPNTDQVFQEALIQELLAFGETPKEPGILYRASRKSGAPSAYYQFEVKTSLERLLAYTYDPDIPVAAFTPASIRLAQWIEVDGGQQPFPKIWEQMADLEKPWIIRGVEHIENTPDQHSGAYFDYDLDRTVILTTHRGRNVLISMSRQRGVSNVGKRGFILGIDEDWNYLYTGMKGINRSGLGWVDSYMYDSHAIMIYQEVETVDDSGTPAPTVRLSVFKWLKAGWAGINMVKPTHIYAGMDRYAKTFKRIIENPALPAPDVLAAYYSPILDLSPPQLRQEIRAHLDELRAQFGQSKAFTDKRFAALFSSNQYVDGMSVAEMRAMLANRYTKKLVGRQ